MRKYLLPKSGTFYKANLHCHSDISDGTQSITALKDAYKAAGYSVLAYTDHNLFLPHHELTDEDFLALAGFEVQYNEDGNYPSGKDYGSSHFCFIAKTPDMIIQPDWNELYAYIGNSAKYWDQVQYDKTLPKTEKNRLPETVNCEIENARKADFFITYNHPVWSLDNYEVYTKFSGMHAMEIYNHDCHTIGYDSYVPTIYDDMLRSGKRIFAVASDDNHNKLPFDHPQSDSFGGFTMIKAPCLQYEAITDALFAGDFYASQGPEIYDLYVEDNFVYIRCSAAKSIVLNTNRRSAQPLFARAGEPLTEARFPLDEQDIYIRLTVTDESGNHANTRAYFLDEI